MTRNSANIDLSKINTYEDMQRYLPPESRYELYEGVLSKIPSIASDMSPAPYGRHQDTITGLFEAIRSYLLQTNSGRAYQAPFDVILPDKTVLQPDVLVFLNEKEHLYEERGFFGPPDLVIEVLSKGTLKADYDRKFHLYEKHGVPEYWIVSPEFKTVEVYILNTDNLYDLDECASNERMAASRVLPAFEVELEKVFNPWRR